MMARSASGRARGRSGPRGRSNTPGWGWEFLARPEHSRFWLVVGFVVRRRAELTVITVVWLGFVQLDSHVTPGLPGWMTPAQWAWLLMAATLAVVLAVPVCRRYTLRRTTAVVMRHRMRACFLQTRTWTANGRLPFLVWSRPTPVGYVSECGSQRACPSTTSNASSKRSGPHAGPARPASPRCQGRPLWCGWTSSAATHWALRAHCRLPWSITSTRTGIRRGRRLHSRRPTAPPSPPRRAHH